MEFLKTLTPDYWKLDNESSIDSENPNMIHYKQRPSVCTGATGPSGSYGYTSNDNDNVVVVRPKITPPEPNETSVVTFYYSDTKKKSLKKLDMI
jgi:hypothetical protein